MQLSSLLGDMKRIHKPLYMRSTHCRPRCSLGAVNTPYPNFFCETLRRSVMPCHCPGQCVTGHIHKQCTWQRINRGPKSSNSTQGPFCDWKLNNDAPANRSCVLQAILSMEYEIHAGTALITVHFRGATILIARAPRGTTWL